MTPGDDARRSRDGDIASGYVGVHLKSRDATKCSWLTVTRRHLPGVQGQRSPPGVTVIVVPTFRWPQEVSGLGST